jgi:hypothetical protein
MRHIEFFGLLISWANVAEHMPDTEQISEDEKWFDALERRRISGVW